MIDRISDFFGLYVPEPAHGAGDEQELRTDGTLGSVAQALWLVGDSFRFAKWRVLAFFLAQTAGQALQIGALIVAVTYLSGVESGDSVTRFGRTYDLSGSATALAWATGAALVLLMVAAVSTWLSRAIAARLVRTYEEHCTARTLRIIAEQPGVWGLPISKDERTILQLVTKDTRYCGRALLEILLGTGPIVLGTAALGFMLYVRPVLTTVIVGAMALALPLFARVNRRAAESLADIEEHAAPHTHDQSALIRRLNGTMLPLRDEDMPLSSNEQFEHTRAYLDAYEYRLKATHGTLLIGNLQLAIVVASVILFFGYSVLVGDSSVTGLLAYVLALQYFTGSVRKLAMRATNLNIFRQSFGRQVAFVREARAQRGAVATGARSRPLEIAVERPIAGSGAAARVEPGTPVAIITNTPLTRLALPDLVETLYGARAPDAVAAAFATGDYPPMEGSLRRSLGLTTATSTGLEGEVLGDDRSRVLAELQDGDVAVSEELWDSIMPATKLFFGAWAALETEPQVVFLDAEAVAAVEPNERKILLERAGPAIVFVTYPTVPDALPEWVADMYLMRHKGAIRYIGARERFGNDREMLERFVERPSKTPLAEPFDPEDDTL